MAPPVFGEGLRPVRRPRYSEDQIIKLLRQVQRRLAQGEPLAAACRALGISSSSYRRWREKHGQDTHQEHLAVVCEGGELSPQASLPIPESALLAKSSRTARGTSAAEPSKNAEKLLDAANAASGPARNAWLAFLALIAYLLVTLGGVSHKDLLLNSPVKLPIINVQIPLFSFFQYAPLLLLLVYLSLLIQHVVLTRKYRKFVEAIAPNEKQTQTEDSRREMVHSYVVSQLLAGSRGNALIRWLMVLMVAVTFAGLPLLTLLYFQITFLPYHDTWITYWHRIAVLLGLAMGLSILPMVHVLPIIGAKSEKREVRIGEDAAWRKSPIGIALVVFFGIVVLGFSWLIATIPDEATYRIISFSPYNDPFRPKDDKGLLNPLVRVAYDFLSDAKNPDDRGWLLPWLIQSRVLVVEDTDLVSDENDRYGEVSEVLRERDLRYARLSRSDLHRADLSEADLRGAQMRRTRLEKVKLRNAQLQGADLSSANLQGANLVDAKLQGVNLADSELQGADLRRANLQGANLAPPPLSHRDVALGVRSLRPANLQGADLRNATLWGANLRNAQLQGAYLYKAELHGADLRNAQLQGADLRRIEFHGADFGSAKIWLARLHNNPLNPMFTYKALGLADTSTTSLTTDEKANIEKALEDRVTDAGLYKLLTDRLEPILRTEPSPWDDQRKWAQIIRRTPDLLPRELVSILAQSACANGYIANVLVRRATDYSHDEGRREYGKPLAKALLGLECQSMKSLTTEMRVELRELSLAD